MTRHYVDRAAVNEFIAQIGAAISKPGRLYLVGETTQVFEGWRERAGRLEFSAEVAPDDRGAVVAAVRGFQAARGLERRRSRRAM